MTTTPPFDPPFDPPYVSLHRTDEGIQYLETLADGTTRPISGAAVGTTWPCTGEAGGMDTRTEGNAKTVGGKTAPGSAPSSAGAGRAVVFLKVPFADKDAAKALGARWNAAQKKWYVPHGVDVNLFSRWLAD